MITQANRGMGLESMINYSNEIYRTRGIAVIHKRPVPVKIIRTKGNQILQAYLEAHSTVDYEGVYREHSLQFEAKSTRVKTRFDLVNFHTHQVEHLRSCARHGAVAFVIVEFATSDERYLLPADTLIRFWDVAQSGGSKSIPLQDVAESGFRISSGRGVPVDYLAIVDRLLDPNTA